MQPVQPTEPKTAMPIVAGILTLISGGGKLLGVVGLLIAGFFVSLSPGIDGRFAHPLVIFTVIGIFLLISGVIAVIGGIYTLRRQNWGMSLTGAIFAFLPFNLLGLASIILLALCRREFES